MIEALENMYHRFDLKDDGEYKTIVVTSLVTIAKELKRLNESVESRRKDDTSKNDDTSS